MPSGYYSEYSGLFVAGAFVLRLAEEGKQGVWLVRCACGSEFTASTSRITGALRGDNTLRCLPCWENKRRKGYDIESSEYASWVHMKSRCNDKNSTSWHRYGGRGITVCERWDTSFQSFLDDMGPKPSPEHSIDRIDNDGNYEPENCRWATKEIQNTNKSTNVYVTFEGETKCLSDWARHYGLSKETLIGRFKRGERDSKLFRPTDGKKQGIDIEYNGQVKKAEEWSKIFNIARKTILYRYRRGDRGDHLFRPVETKFRRRS